MAQKSRKLVLYEVIGQNQAKIPIGQKIKQLRSKERKKGSYRDRTRAEKVPKDAKNVSAAWPPRRRALRIVLDKIISGRGISSRFNPIRTIMILLIVTVVLVGIKIGQNRMKADGAEVVSGSKESGSIGPGVVEESLPLETSEDLISSEKGEVEKTAEESMLLGPVGDHVIVIMTYGENRDLEPVKGFFAENGIPTTIEKRGEYYFLLSKGYYQSPQRQNSDGYKALQTIKKIGASYQAPVGYETFGSMPFQDAYGMKIR